MRNFRAFFLIIVSVFGFSEGGSRLKLDGRIVGGEDADIKDFPYQLSLRTSGRDHFCGASIISDHWALTAAHCVENLVHLPHVLQIVGGIGDRNEVGIRHSVNKIIVHSRFSLNTLDYDIAVIKVNHPFRTWSKSSNERKINLPNQGQVVHAGTIATTSGWGVTNEDSYSLPNQLQSVQVPIVSQYTCRKDYPNEEITDRMICAGVVSGGKDACQGDSGGPLVVNDRQVGIVSWGLGCAEPNSPGVYTNVANLRNWIREKTNV